MGPVWVHPDGSPCRVPDALQPGHPLSPTQPPEQSQKEAVIWELQPISQLPLSSQAKTGDTISSEPFLDKGLTHFTTSDHFTSVWVLFYFQPSPSCQSWEPVF